MVKHIDQILESKDLGEFRDLLLEGIGEALQLAVVQDILVSLLVEKIKVLGHIGVDSFVNGGEVVAPVISGLGKGGREARTVIVNISRLKSWRFVDYRAHP